MVDEYIEYLKQLNNRLRRNNIVLPIDLSCDNTHLADQVTVLEQFLYFNQVLKISDSTHKIDSLLEFDDISLNDFLKNQIYEKYESEWNKKLLELTKQPIDAGIVNKPLKIISRREADLMTESLGLKQEKIYTSFVSSWGNRESLEFDDDDEGEEDDDDDEDDYSVYLEEDGVDASNEDKFDSWGSEDGSNSISDGDSEDSDEESADYGC